jgi:hypothetical protein
VQRASRYEYARAVAGRYRRAGKRQKGRILDEFCAATGYTRKHALGLLQRPPPAAPAPVRRPRARRYGAADVELLRACWLIADRICGKRLAPFLPELLARLAACAALPPEATPELVARVGRVSAATVDRLLAADRERWPERGLGTTKPGTLLKQQIPVRTSADWDDARPGFCEMDTVAHCGPSGAGEFLFTLSLVDVCTGWVACQGVRNKSEQAVFAALGQVRRELPFPLLGLDSDNGSEFINQNLLRYCQAERISLTRGRPYRKNDGCHIEQKNWSVVRRLVGYGRFEGVGALAALDRVHALGRDYTNFCQPVRKLLGKTRQGAKVTKRYDRAQTPDRRLLATGILSPDQAARLAERYAGLSPIRLKLDLEEAQQALYAHAVRSDPSVRQRPGLGRIYS